MPRYFEFKDDKSSKFWEIELQGNSFTVRYGKIGTTGQTQTKEFADDAAAEKEYNKLVAEKTKKGYAESAAGASAPAATPTSNVVKMPAAKKPEADRHSMKSAQRSAKDFSDDDEDEDEEDDDDEPRKGRTAGGASAGMRRFEFEDDKSSKFWAISIDGSSFTVCYGRIGTEGQTQTKDWDSEAKAQKEYDKLVQEKIKKGYEEVESDEEEEDDFDDDDDNDSEEDGEGVFAGKPIEEWDPENGIDDPREYAYKIGLTYEEDDGEGLTWPDKFAGFLEDPKASKVEALVVGSWGSQSMCEGTNSEAIVEALVAARDQLPNLRAIFVADVEGEDCEISWIQQSDMSPLFDAYPKLTHFRVRGGMELQLGTLKHSKLQSLVLESGGLSTNVVQSVSGAQLPELVHLELWLGTQNYGGDYTIKDLRPILDGKVLPKLKYLGLRNSQVTDRIAAALKDAAILKRISELDLSMGTLGDKGAEALLNNPLIAKIKKVNVAHHYMTPEVIERMEARGNFFGLDEVEEREDEDEEDEDEGDENEEFDEGAAIEEPWDGRYCEVSE